MPLPKLEHKPGVGETRRSGRDFTDISTLLRDLHDGVLELGVGKCEVLAHDVPREEAKFGFDLCQDPSAGEWRVWEFLIPVRAFKQTSEALSDSLREEFKSLTGRGRLARMLQAGLDARSIEERLRDPAFLFVLRKIKELTVLVNQAQDEAQQEMKVPIGERRQRYSLMRPRPATQRFLLQYQIEALSDLLGHLEIGVHLIPLEDSVRRDL